MMEDRLFYAVARDTWAMGFSAPDAVRCWQERACSKSIPDVFKLPDGVTNVRVSTDGVVTWVDPEQGRTWTRVDPGSGLPIGVQHAV